MKKTRLERALCRVEQAKCRLRRASKRMDAAGQRIWEQEVRDAYLELECALVAKK